MAKTIDTARWKRGRRNRRVRFAFYFLLAGSLLTWRLYRPIRNRLLSDERRFEVLRGEALAETNLRRRKRLLNEMLRDFSGSGDPRAGQWLTWTVRRQAEDILYGDGRPNPPPPRPFFPPPPPEPELPVSPELRELARIPDAVERDRLLDGFIARYEEDPRPEAACWVTAALVRKAEGAVVRRIGELAQERIVRNGTGCDGLYGRRILCWIMDSRYRNAHDYRDILSRLDELLAAFGKDEDPFIRPAVVAALLRKAGMVQDQAEAFALYSDALAAVRDAGPAAADVRSAAIMGAAESMHWPPARNLLYDLVIREFSDTERDSIRLRVVDAWLAKADLQADPEERIRMFEDILRRYDGEPRGAVQGRLGLVSILRDLAIGELPEGSPLRFPDGKR